MGLTALAKMILAFIWSDIKSSLITLAVVFTLAIAFRLSSRASPSRNKNIPISVNYHYTRQCNKACKFCFHTAKTSFKQPLDDAKRGLALLQKAGMKKINFAGGEPFLHPARLGAMIAYCKEELHIESVSIVTNGSLVEEKFLQSFGRHIDILAVSCDSFNEQTNIDIGRGSGDTVRKLFQIAAWCRAYGIKFKLNTVVCALNHTEDMNDLVSQLRPFRWKCFQVLLVAGENDSSTTPSPTSTKYPNYPSTTTLRDARPLRISEADYAAFCRRHAHQPSFVAEPNHLMARSYLILDEYMRFLDRDGGNPSGGILEVGVEKALREVFWDREGFLERGGVYDWSREKGGEGMGEGEGEGCGGTGGKELEW